MSDFCQGPMIHPRATKWNKTQYWYCGVTDTFVVGPCEHIRIQPLKPKPQDTDSKAPGYFPPYNDMGMVRTINNAVDAGWAYPSEEERKIRDKCV